MNILFVLLPVKHFSTGGKMLSQLRSDRQNRTHYISIIPCAKALLPLLCVVPPSIYLEREAFTKYINQPTKQEKLNTFQGSRQTT